MLIKMPVYTHKDLSYGENYQRWALQVWRHCASARRNVTQLSGVPHGKPLATCWLS